MSLFAPQYQIVSDLHLETPITQPLYKSLRLHTEGTHILLLGDIGLAKDEDLFTWLRNLLSSARGCRIFYVLGNHESYQLAMHDTIQRFRGFEDEATLHFGGRFIFLNRDRYDVDGSTSILGCTLWSAVLPRQASEVFARMTDFNEQRGIHGWSLEAHLEAHQQDREWLNAQVAELEENEPHRQIIIATHHSPTVDPRAVSPRHRNSSVSSAFATDLSRDRCWTSPLVKLWAFGHTHYNCKFRDDVTRKWIVANQRGYGKSKAGLLTVEPDAGDWTIRPAGSRVTREAPGKSNSELTSNDVCQSKHDDERADHVRKEQQSLLGRAIRRVPGLRR